VRTARSWDYRAGMTAPQPRAPAAARVRTVKNVVDRIETFHELKGRPRGGTTARCC
jgi:hypothetical protein